MKRTRTMTAGISLIEMLVTLLIVAVGLLGLAGLQAYAMKNNNSAYHRSQADLLAYDILDCVRTDRDTWLDGKFCYTTDGTALSCVDGSTNPTAGSRPDRDLKNWATYIAGDAANQVPGVLPGGAGLIDCKTDSPVCTVIIQWEDHRGIGLKQQLIVSTRL